jgi:hypothetical protein
MLGFGKRFFISVIIILLFLTILVPLITFVGLTNSYNSVIDTHINKERDLQQQVDSLTEQNNQLKAENSQLTNLSRPYFITSLGWYLHKSDDPVASSKNTFTTYGTIYNIGNLPANNAELTVRFYGRNETLLQTSTIHLGIIPSITNSTIPFAMGIKNIDCSMADAVTDIDLSLHYQ